MKYAGLWTTLLLIFFLIGVNSQTPNDPQARFLDAANADAANPTHHHHNESTIEEEQEAQIRYREEFCDNQNNGTVRKCEPFNRFNLRFYFSLFAIMAWGATVRIFQNTYNFPIPYTIILMLTGMGIGLTTRISDDSCSFFATFTKIARMPPRVILFVFLPILIFESAFGTKAHVFFRSTSTILLLAFPGMLVTTFATAALCFAFLTDYGWSFMVSCLFGSIISATDPVAVVAILKEIGAAESLSVAVEGESLLNDGVAILLFEIFDEIVKADYHGDNQALDIFLQFIRITLGGPLLGYIIAKFAIFFMSKIFNDAAVEVSITIVAAYLTYYLAEGFLGVSGVIAVVTLGILMSYESTCISPEVQGLLHHFWSMLGYLANTVLFVLVGIVITETAITTLTWTEVYYLFFLYVMLNVVRFIMVLMFTPFLKRIGYQLSWQNLLVLSWGGLRGAVGVCLTLQVYYDKELCQNQQIGPKFLLQTAGIVILTLLVNGTTSKAMLDMLGLSSLTVGKLQDMANAVAQVQSAQLRSLTVIKHDSFLADSNWQLVEEYTEIRNPYLKKTEYQEEQFRKQHKETPSLLSLNENPQRITICPNCDEPVVSEPSPEEVKEMTEEARARMLKALKVSIWRQYEQGILSEYAVHVITDRIEDTEDQNYHMLHASDFQKYFDIHGFFPWIRKKMRRMIPNMTRDYHVPQKPCLLSLFDLVSHVWFDRLVNILILINIAFILTEIVLISIQMYFYEWETILFNMVNCAFILVLMVEFLLKNLVLGKQYWKSKWNYIDVLVLIISLIEMSISLAFLVPVEWKISDIKTEYSATVENFVLHVPIVRIVRVVRLVRPLFPFVMRYVDGRVNEQWYIGYDISQGLVVAIEDVLKFLDQMVQNAKILAKLKRALQVERLDLVIQLGMMQKNHPGIAIAVKTKHACRSVLNQMRDSLKELREDGLIFEKEYILLTQSLEERMKRLWHSPVNIAPGSFQTIISNVSWIMGNAELENYIMEKATRLDFTLGDTICTAGDSPNGIYIIVAGLVRESYIPTDDVISDREDFGVIPNMEVFQDLSFEYEAVDYLSVGTVIGEIGLLTGLPCAATVTCHTSVVAFHIGHSAMMKALKAFDDMYDSLEARMWRAVGMRLATALLPTQPAFSSWTLDKVRVYLEHSAVPLGPIVENMTIPDFISDVVVIYGQIGDYHSGEVRFTAPCLISHSCTKLMPIPDAPVVTRLLVLANMEEGEEDEDGGSQQSIHRHLSKSFQQFNNPDATADVEVKQKRKAPVVNFGVREDSRNVFRREEEQEEKQASPSQTDKKND